MQTRSRTGPLADFSLNVSGVYTASTGYLTYEATFPTVFIGFRFPRLFRAMRDLIDSLRTQVTAAGFPPNTALLVYVAEEEMRPSGRIRWNLTDYSLETTLDQLTPNALLTDWEQELGSSDSIYYIANNLME